MEPKAYAEWVMDPYDNDGIESTFTGEDGVIEVRFNDSMSVKDAMEFTRYVEQSGYNYIHRTIAGSHVFEPTYE